MTRFWTFDMYVIDVVLRHMWSFLTQKSSPIAEHQAELELLRRYGKNAASQGLPLLWRAFVQRAVDQTTRSLQTLGWSLATMRTNAIMHLPSYEINTRLQSKCAMRGSPHVRTRNAAQAFVSCDMNIAWGENWFVMIRGVHSELKPS